MSEALDEICVTFGKEILKIVRKLVDEGQIVLGGKGGDEALVG